MAKIDFTPIIEYIDKKIEQLKEKLPSKEDFRQLQVAVDANSKEIKDFRVEMATLTHRTDRVEGWIGKAAPKVGIPYET